MRAKLPILMSSLVLTILIWTYADWAQHESPEVDILVVLRHDPNFRVHVKDAPDETPDRLTVRVKLTGPRGAIRRLEHDRAGGLDFSFKIPVTDRVDTTIEHEISNLSDELNQWSELRDRGLHVVEVARETVVFTVDRLRELTLEVQADAGSQGDTLIGPPEVQPATVEVKVLDSEWAKLGSPEMVVRVVVDQELKQYAGEWQPSFGVTLPAKWQGIDAKFDPATVWVTAERDVRRKSTLFASIPLSVRIVPWRYWAEGRYTIEWDPREREAQQVQSCRVEVPVGKEGELTSDQITAEIVITRFNLPEEPAAGAASAPAEASFRSMTVHIRLPPAGFEDFRIDTTEENTVKLRVVRVGPGAESGSGTSP